MIKIGISVTSHALDPLPCHKLSHLLGPPSNVTYFMNGPILAHPFLSTRLSSTLSVSNSSLLLLLLLLLLPLLLLLLLLLLYENISAVAPFNLAFALLLSTHD